MKDTTYTATFSTGTITRKSHHTYATAAAYINKETGAIKNVTFSKNIANANPTGLFGHKSPERRWYSTKTEWLKAIEENKVKQQLWKMEVVNV